VTTLHTSNATPFQAWTSNVFFRNDTACSSNVARDTSKPTQPVRNASRNAPGLRTGSPRPSRICQFCGNEYEGSSRPSSYCGALCRQRAFRARRRQPVVPPLPRRTHALDVLYECSSCGERLLNEQRCKGCSRFARWIGVAVACPTCDEPILLSELLEQLQ
jgi:hypothetical protein